LAFVLLTKEQRDEVGYVAPVGEDELILKMAELVCYLWDNYLEGYESNDIAVMGVGYSYLAVRMLLTNRGIAFSLLSSPSPPS
jgi:histone deacetylase 6